MRVATRSEFQNSKRKLAAPSRADQSARVGSGRGEASQVESRRVASKISRGNSSKDSERIAAAPSCCSRKLASTFPCPLFCRRDTRATSKLCAQSDWSAGKPTTSFRWKAERLGAQASDDDHAALSPPQAAILSGGRSSETCKVLSLKPSSCNAAAAAIDNHHCHLPRRASRTRT